MNLEQTLAQRGSRYGDFSVHAEIAQNIQDEMRNAKGWVHLSPVQKQALTVIADKIARILSGDPNYDDNWHDIQGYAKLVEDRLIDVSEDPAKQFQDSLGKRTLQGNPGIEQAMRHLDHMLTNQCTICHQPGGHGDHLCPSLVVKVNS